MDPTPELELYIVRHGQSRTNAGLADSADFRRFEDPFLTEAGAAQAQKLGAFYASLPLDCILSSGQNRALQTAGAVVKGRETPSVVEVHPVFTECGLKSKFGEKRFSEIREVFPFAVPAGGTDPAGNFVFTQDEDEDEKYLSRAREAICYLRARFHAGEKVMVVAHAAFETFMVFAALGLETTPAYDFSFANTGVSKLVFYPAGTGLYGSDVHLIYHNDRSHLAGQDADPLTLISAR